MFTANHRIYFEKFYMSLIVVPSLPLRLTAPSVGGLRTDTRPVKCPSMILIISTQYVQAGRA